MTGRISDQIPAARLNGEEWLLLAYNGQNYKVTVKQLLDAVPLPTLAVLGLDQVNNTSDLDKPLSRAVIDALNIKAAAIHKHSIDDIDELTDKLAEKADVVAVNQTIQDLMVVLASKSDLSNLQSSIQNALSQYVTLNNLQSEVDNFLTSSNLVEVGVMEW
jgi:UDP-glucose 6-dehydrogenase